MLQQILDTGYIDPELEEQLTEEQKELLYRKIREEQIRKWHVREEKLQTRGKAAKGTDRKINFLLGRDGNPWVWVMGEHASDLSYEELVKKREQEEAEREARALREEAEKLAKNETTDILKAASKNLPMKEGIDASESPRQIPVARSESMLDVKPTESPESEKKPSSKARWKMAVDNRLELLKSMTPEERERYQKRRTEEILSYMRHAAEVKKKRSSLVVSDAISQWQESEEKAKSYEMRRKMSISRAKQIDRTERNAAENILKKIALDKQEPRQERAQKLGRIRTPQKPNQGGFRERKNALQLKKSTLPSKDTQPTSLSHAIAWFKNFEVPKGVGRELDGTISLWFHGTIVRQNADSLLQPMAVGSFLVRISTKVWGYTISVRSHSHVRHFMVDASSGDSYRLIGTHHPDFPSLSKLLKYYRTNPVTWAGQEMLLVPCEQPFEQLKSVQLLCQREDEEEDDEEDEECANELTLL